MTSKVYRTAHGKTIDLGALQLKNEKVRAVGNMNVNARGDLLDSKNRPIDSRNQQVTKQYNKQTNVSHESIYKKPNKVTVPPPPEDFEDDFDKKVLNNPEPNAESGIGAAMARARKPKG